MKVIEKIKKKAPVDHHLHVNTALNKSSGTQASKPTANPTKKSRLEEILQEQTESPKTKGGHSPTVITQGSIKSIYKKEE